jgi:predicted transcriptional regulator YheO
MINVATYNIHPFTRKEMSMVSSISSIGINSTVGIGSSQNMQSLTDEQKQKIADILSKYDAKNLTADDAKAIFKAFKEAGITPAKGMKEAIEAAGFDAEKLRSEGMSDADKAGHKPPPPPPPSSSDSSSDSSSTVNVSALKSLQDILSQYDLTNLSSEDQTSLVSKLQEQGLLNTGYLIDLKS